MLTACNNFPNQPFVLKRLGIPAQIPSSPLYFILYDSSLNEERSHFINFSHPQIISKSKQVKLKLKKALKKNCQGSLWTRILTLVHISSLCGKKASQRISKYMGTIKVAILIRDNAKFSLQRGQWRMQRGRDFFVLFKDRTTIFSGPSLDGALTFPRFFGRFNR